MAHPEYSATAGLWRVYLLVATSAVAANLMFLYVVFQRVKVTPTADPDTDDYGGAVVVQEAETQESPVAQASGDPEQDQILDRATAQSTTELRTPIAPTDQGEQVTVVGRRGNRHASFLELLPRELGSDIVYLESEDHYVKVVTGAGSSLVKMRFGDAVAELGEMGVQVHRCYWVASHHVQELMTRDRKLLLRLSGNHEVPVSRTYLGVVKLAIGDVGAGAGAIVNVGAENDREPGLGPRRRRT